VAAQCTEVWTFAFGLTWLGVALIFLGILSYPTSMAGFGSVSGIVLLMTGFGPTIAAFVMTAFTEGRSGVRTLWRRFWNRNLSIRWLLVTLLIFPALALAVNLVSRTLDGQAYSGHHLGCLAPPYVFYPWSASLPKGFLDLAPWVVLSSILYTWIYNNTKGSVLAAVLLHAMMNTGIIWCCGTLIQTNGRRFS
jgi:hypothetical protein